MAERQRDGEYRERVRQTVLAVLRERDMSHVDLARALQARGLAADEWKVGRWARGDHTPYGDILLAVLEIGGMQLPAAIGHSERVAAVVDVAISAELEALRRRLDEMTPALERSARSIREAILALPPVDGDPSDYITIKQAASLVGVTRQAIDLRITNGQLQAFRRGRNRVVRREDVERLYPEESRSGGRRQDTRPGKS